MTSTPGPVMYCNCMEEVKLRVGVILAVVEKGLTVGREGL